MEFTPNTDQVRETWAEVQDATFGEGLDSHGDEFDRWLNEDRAKVWGEAITFFETNIYGEITSANEYNPYRKADQ